MQHNTLDSKPVAPASESDPAAPAPQAAEQEFLTADEERALARAWREHGCVASRNALVERNVRLVHAVARGFDHRGLTRDDLVAEGSMGLLRAACNFDPDAGCRFSTFAYQHIRHAMVGLFSAGSVRSRLPRGLRRDVSLWTAAVASLTAQHGAPPSDEEIAAHLGWTVASARRARSAHAGAAKLATISSSNHHEVSLDGSPDAEPDEHREPESDTARLLSLFSHLTPREREAIELLYGIDRPWRVGRDAAAAVMGCSVATIRQLQHTAEFKLRRHARRIAVSSPHAAAELAMQRAG